MDTPYPIDEIDDVMPQIQQIQIQPGSGYHIPGSDHSEKKSVSDEKKFDFDVDPQWTELNSLGKQIQRFNDKTNTMLRLSPFDRCYGH